MVHQFLVTVATTRYCYCGVLEGQIAKARRVLAVILFESNYQVDGLTSNWIRTDIRSTILTSWSKVT